MSTATLRTQSWMVVATMVLFLAMLALNEWLFTRLEFARGINWIYLPAGARLLCPLLFAEAGVLGLLLVSWLVSFCWFFPDDPLRAFMGGLLAALAPYLVFVAARRAWGLQVSLASLTPGRLMVLAVACSIASPLLHHIWFYLRGDDNILAGFTAMFIGDLNGTLIVIYMIKGLLALVPARAA